MTGRARLRACRAFMGLLGLPVAAAVAEAPAASAGRPHLVWRRPTEYAASRMPGEGLAAVAPIVDAAAGLPSGAMIGAVEAP